MFSFFEFDFHGFSAHKLLLNDYHLVYHFFNWCKSSSSFDEGVFYGYLSCLYTYHFFSLPDYERLQLEFKRLYEIYVARRRLCNR